MQKLSDENQAMLDIMEIAQFPIRVERGLYTWDERELGFPPRMGTGHSVHSTDDFSKVIDVFNFWRKRNNNEH